MAGEGAKYPHGSAMVAASVARAKAAKGTTTGDTADSTDYREQANKFPAADLGGSELTEGEVEGTRVAKGPCDGTGG